MPPGTQALMGGMSLILAFTEVEAQKVFSLQISDNLESLRLAFCPEKSPVCMTYQGKR